MRSARGTGPPAVPSVMRMVPLCCARAASGHAMAEPVTTLMKSRRRIAFPKAGTTPIRTGLQQGFAINEMGFRVSLHASNLEPLIRGMSALCQKRTLHFIRATHRRVAGEVEVRRDRALWQSLD